MYRKYVHLKTGSLFIFNFIFNTIASMLVFTPQQILGSITVYWNFLEFFFTIIQGLDTVKIKVQFWVK